MMCFIPSSQATSSNSRKPPQHGRCPTSPEAATLLHLLLVDLKLGLGHHHIGASGPWCFSISDRSAAPSALGPFSEVSPGILGCGSKLNRRGYAGFGPCFLLPASILEFRFFEPQPLVLFQTNPRRGSAFFSHFSQAERADWREDRPAERGRGPGRVSKKAEPCRHSDFVGVLF